MPIPGDSRSRQPGEPDRIHTSKVRGTDLRLLPVALCTWGGALAGLKLAAPFVQMWPALLLVFGASIAVFVPRLTVASVAVVATSVALATSSQAAHQRDFDPLTQAATIGRHVTITGVTNSYGSASSAPWKKDVLQLQMQVSEVELQGVRYPSNVVALIDISGLDNPLLTSATILVKGTKVRVSGIAKTPYFNNATTTAAISTSEFQVLAEAPKWSKTVGSLRYQMTQITSEAAGELGPLITGMAIGDDNALPKQTKEAMLTTSLTHLTAVSGSHIAISLMLIHSLFAGWRKTQTVLIGLFLVLVITVVGAEPSVVRATSMSALAAWGMFRKRPGQPLALLFVVIVVTILLDPWVAVSVGFALSAVATFGILTLGRFLARVGMRVVHEGPWQVEGLSTYLLSMFVDAVAIAFSAYLVGIPILALINPWLPTWGIVANLLVSPVVAPLTLLGLGVAVTALPVPSLSFLFATLALPFAAWMKLVATVFAGAPFAQMPWPQGVGGALMSVGLISMGACAVYVWCLWFERRRTGTEPDLWSFLWRST